MNRHYHLIGITNVPVRDGDESSTIIRTYAIDEERRHFLDCVMSYNRNDGTYDPSNPAPDDVREAGTIYDVIGEDLGLFSDYFVAPGVIYHTYDINFWHGVVMVADTMAYNV